MDQLLEIFTDGGCHGNPGPGAWAYCIVDSTGNVVRCHSGFDGNTTNNRMELQAVISALRFVAEAEPGARTEIVTDSEYVKRGVTEWIYTWKRNGWKTAAKKPVKNRELWQQLDLINGRVAPKWRWVRGHSGNEFNEMCDTLVQEEIARNR